MYIRKYVRYFGGKNVHWIKKFKLYKVLIAYIATLCENNDFC